ncbi:hypothetical protein IOD14_20725 [Streptomyces sp. A2-16]|uniref:hypothetical protein n=1 Tax=Streptomyces sp. A2-16 TaxID=2781734 RepID=UPI001BAFF4F2|nr:hypothetical protein [Streptomyces sp. A2-16]QUC59013.1 hypothetical protein IOD14_20725 [Streptomyces sp. A2-16]
MSDISWSPEDEKVLLAAQHEVLMGESQSEIETLGERLANLPVGPKERNRERIGAVALGALGVEPEVLAEPIGDMRLAHCQALERPVFSLQSPEDESLTMFSRANAEAATLEVTARAGALNGQRYPSAESTPPNSAFNTATAWIGAPVALPAHESPIPGLPPLAHGPLILDVRVELQVEHTWSHAPVQRGTAANLVWTAPGSADLPLYGSARVWCRAGLTVHGAGGVRSRRSVIFVGERVNRSGKVTTDRTDDGLVTLSHAVAISSELVVAGIFVDITCFASAEESPENESDSAFAEFQCENRDGAFPPPSRLKLNPERVRVRLCELAALVK